ncbi:bifunctional 4-hydroxy-2-oxoglutarate aldolase/2-dehydro-3-deoxy-phosphogluconate aldolase [Neoactinobaculum massilliense]|uniref:bifunctional 4-hydroxy-2-oxoglutarate aldolase/2-dehydro-3-deoxy-phosphogluconate aldolase n=1 Tax=Neoactinobaculum massilliense TaxID=2364794 RepID=UPI000F53592D|nr:bifunctional 4-hydroxy-2-oxoglutarate aldolase/2-dehydro-3-deoxy-phosphogluconate aldolase [Neoactinobaculum massilliense]
MTKQLPNALPLLEANPIVPVVVIDDAADAVDTAKALVAGGIGVAEVTFRTAAGGDAIAAMKDVEGMTVGAGTVLNGEQATKAIDLGAHFLVSPGWNEDIADVAIDRNIPYLPGVQTATEVMMALKFGAKVVKFFPGGEAGGLKMVKALRGPFNSTFFLPSGGVNQDNLAEWVSYEGIAAVSGSWVAKRALINDHNFAEITRIAKLATDTVKEIRK